MQCLNEVPGKRSHRITPSFVARYTEERIEQPLGLEKLEACRVPTSKERPRKIFYEYSAFFTSSICIINIQKRSTY